MHLKLFTSSPLAHAVLLACLHFSSAWAQSDTQSEPTHSGQAVALTYSSAFENYQRYTTTPIQSWKQANDTVKNMGATPAHVHGGQP